MHPFRSAGAGRRPATPRLKVVFEDDDVIVVDKPARLLTIATETEKRRTAYAMLYDYLKSKRPAEQVFVVHRLDREASGLLVFAKNVEAKRRLQAQFHDRRAGRKYRALVEGRVEADRQTLRSHLAETTAHRSYSTGADRGKLAVTHVRVLERGADFTLVEASLETGRKHQIRVQLAEAGHPIAGDERYGSRGNPLRRLALHAATLSFEHPGTGKPLEFRSPPPRGFRALCRGQGDVHRRATR